MPVLAIIARRYYRGVHRDVKQGIRRHGNHLQWHRGYSQKIDAARPLPTVDGALDGYRGGRCRGRPYWGASSPRPHPGAPVNSRLPLVVVRTGEVGSNRCYENRT